MRKNDHESGFTICVYTKAIHFNLIVIDSQLESYLMCKKKLNLVISVDRIIDTSQLFIELHLMCLDAVKKNHFSSNSISCLFEYIFFLSFLGSMSSKLVKKWISKFSQLKRKPSFKWNHVEKTYARRRFMINSDKQTLKCFN